MECETGRTRSYMNVMKRVSVFLCQYVLLFSRWNDLNVFFCINELRRACIKWKSDESLAIYQV